MAQTFTAYFTGIAFGNNKVMAYIQNSHATEVIKIRRVGILNAQTAGVTGVLTLLEARFCTAATFTGATTTGATVQTHDTSNTAPTTYGYGSATSITPTASQLLRRVPWSNDEPATGAGTWDELECIVPLNIVLDSGYGDANVQPLTLRGNTTANCFYLVNVVNTVVGLLDIWIEFTKE